MNVRIIRGGPVGPPPDFPELASRRRTRYRTKTAGVFVGKKFSPDRRRTFTFSLEKIPLYGALFHKRKNHPIYAIRTVPLFLVCLFLHPSLAAAQHAPADTAEVNRVMDSLIQVSRDLTANSDFTYALEISAMAEKIALERLGRESVAYG